MFLIEIALDDSKYDLMLQIQQMTETFSALYNLRCYEILLYVMIWNGFLKQENCYCDINAF